MRLPSIPLDIYKILLLIQILESRVILSKHAGYYVLPFAERFAQLYGSLKKMDNLNWDKKRNYDGFHISLHMRDKKLKLNKGKMKQIYETRLKFHIHGIKVSDPWF